MYDAGVAMARLIALLNQLDSTCTYEIYTGALYYNIYKNGECVLRQLINSMDSYVNILCYLTQELYLKIGD